MRLETLDDPRSIGHGLTGPPLKGFWTYTIYGDWRGVAKIQDSTVTIVIVKIAPRDKVYR